MGHQERAGAKTAIRRSRSGHHRRRARRRQTDGARTRLSHHLQRPTDYGFARQKGRRGGRGSGEDLARHLRLGVVSRPGNPRPEGLLEAHRYQRLLCESVAVMTTTRRRNIKKQSLTYFLAGWGNRISCAIRNDTKQKRNKNLV